MLLTVTVNVSLPEAPSLSVTVTVTVTVMHIGTDTHNTTGRITVIDTIHTTLTIARIGKNWKSSTAYFWIYYG